MGLKLGKLPDRKPVKFTISILPELNNRLEHYAACYQETYGQAENVADLIPFMLMGFLESDKEFLRRSKTAKSDENTP